MTTQKEATDSAASGFLPSAGTSQVDEAASTVPDTVKRLLPAGAFRTDDHRYYFNGSGPNPSVTTVLDQTLMKWDLVNWRVRQAARFGLEAGFVNGKTGDSPVSDDEQVKLVIALVDEAKEEQKRIGSGVHLLADQETRNGLQASETASKAGLIPDEWIPYLDAYRDFSVAYRASENIVSSEKMVWSANGYGGTYDFIIKVKPGTEYLEPWTAGSHELLLVDVKTSKGTYPETGMQLAGYRWADAIILEGDPRPYPMPHIHRTAVLHLRPDKYPDTGWRLIEYPTTYEDDYIAFLGVLEAYKWKQKNRFSRRSQKNGTGST